ncbi:MAG: HAMP domain-containing protein [Lachnospiraceae bacterium]|nr:HAMP domain-containing protein [Lachnospiraceae bacterium]
MPVGIILFAVGVFMLFYNVKYTYEYGNEPMVSFIYYSPNFACVSDDSHFCIIDEYKYVFVRNDDKAEYLVSASDFGYMPSKVNFYEAAFDENNDLYVYFGVAKDDAYVTQYDVIAKVTNNGKNTEEIIKFDYSKLPFSFNRSQNIFAMNFTDGKLKYLKKINDYEFCEYTFDPLTRLSEKSEDNHFNNPFVEACFAEDHGYAFILNNGSVGYFKEGTYTEEYKCIIEDVRNDSDNVVIPEDICFANGKLYILSGSDNNVIYTCENGNLEYCTDFEKLIKKNGLDDTYLLYSSASHIFNNNNAVGAIISDLVVMDINKQSLDSGVYFIDFLYVISSLFKPLSAIFGGLFTILGLIISFGAFVKWKFSILAKQLLFTLPIVAIAFIIIAAVLGNEIGDRYNEDLNENMKTLGNLGAKAFDGDEIEKAVNYDFTENGKAYEYNKILRETVRDNMGDYCKRMDTSLLLYNYKDNECDFYVLAKSSEVVLPFSETQTMISYSLSDYQSGYSDDSLEKYNSNLLDPSIGYAILTTESDTETYTVCDTAIRNSEGKVVAVFEVSSDDNDFFRDMAGIYARIFVLMFILMIILIVFISIISYINVNKLHKASEVVSDIANGDFTKRVEKAGNDEVGEICRGVNDMAEKLDTLFKEKDENEQFYYKFVPEQFKDLLHKDKFTELSLGDAESINLTVLFCDIRSFSLSSEMMTAKENFEFINIIFGIAGPIIRKHNGFVDKYIGDAVMALFEKADDAIKCGEEMYREIVLNPKTAEELKVSSINVGIGIHTGMARIGIIGEEERMSGTVISNTVNLSSRLEGITKQYDTAMIISKDTLDNINNPDSINTRYLGMVQVAGVNEVNALYEVLDCLDEERFKVRNENKNDFREAVRLYHLGDLKGAVEKFESIKSDRILDPALDKYIRYIRHMIETGSTDSNVFRFSRK